MADTTLYFQSDSAGFQPDTSWATTGQCVTSQLKVDGNSSFVTGAFIPSGGATEYCGLMGITPQLTNAPTFTNATTFKFFNRAQASTGAAPSKAQVLVRILTPSGTTRAVLLNMTGVPENISASGCYGHKVYDATLQNGASAQIGDRIAVEYGFTCPMSKQVKIVKGRPAGVGALPVSGYATDNTSAAWCEFGKTLSF